MSKIKRILPYILILCAIVTRFVNIGWGLPYPFHPDERNMADALVSLHCSQFTDCFNPHFFAYGQLPLYLGYLGIQLFHLITLQIGKAIDFSEAVIALRIISAAASVATVFVGVKIVRLCHPERSRGISHACEILASIFLIFSPGLIQFAHFGTTESLLIFFYTSLILVTLLALNSRISLKRFAIFSGILVGLSVGVKVSSTIFVVVPLIGYIYCYSKFKNVSTFIKSVMLFGVLSVFVAMISSPYNFLSPQEFLNSLQYESAVALGTTSVFYTRQFFNSIPILFQFTKIFSYALGTVTTMLFIVGFIFLPKNKSYNLLRLAFLVYFLPTAFLFTKWTRFMAPVFPVMIVFAVLFIQRLVETGRDLSLRNVMTYLLILLMIIPGIQYLSVYLREDTRFAASRWIYEHVPPNSVILGETANVVNLPISPSVIKQPLYYYNYIPFNFYDLDTDPNLATELESAISAAQYIVVPSGRIYDNHTCAWVDDLAYQNKRCEELEKMYPLVHNYYRKLFSGEMGFEKVAEFSAAQDNRAEETWSVFDHPVVQIFKRK